MSDATRSGHRPNERRVPLPALWFALLGGPVAWSVHLLASYPLVPVACGMGSTAPLIAITIVMAVLSGAAATTGWWAWRRSGGGSTDSGRDSSRPAFMGLVGFLLALLFTFAILMEGLPVVLQNPCLEGL